MEIIKCYSSQFYSPKSTEPETIISKKGFLESVYDKIQQAPDGQQQKVGDLKLEKPIEVLNEQIQKTKEIGNKESVDISKTIKESKFITNKIVYHITLTYIFFRQKK